jgi:hypothetical protein
MCPAYDVLTFIAENSIVCRNCYGMRSLVLVVSRWPKTAMRISADFGRMEAGGNYMGSARDAGTGQTDLSCPDENERKYYCKDNTTRVDRGTTYVIMFG